MLKYNVTAKLAAVQALGGVVGKKRLLGIFASVVSALGAAEDYMIDASSLIIDLNSIFVDVASNSSELICLPVVGAGTPDLDLKAFFKNILVNTQFDKNENGDYVIKLIGSLNAPGAFSLSEFGRLISGLAGETKQAASIVSSRRAAPPIPPPPPPQPVQTPQAAPRTATPQVKPAPSVVKPSPSPAIDEDDEKKISLFYLLQHYNPENKALYDAQKQRKKSRAGGGAAVSPFTVPGRGAPPINTAPPAPQNPPIAEAPLSTRRDAAPEYAEPPASRAKPDYGDTIDMSSARDYENDDSTVVLGQASDVSDWQPHLIRKSNGEKIMIGKPSFSIGRDRGFVDYVVSGNIYVGHAHCHIITRGGEYFIVDDNSKNHTFVDGQMIQPSTEVKLAHGHSVKLADEEFEFRIY
jgi:hypothetical protein